MGLIVPGGGAHGIAQALDPRFGGFFGWGGDSQAVAQHGQEALKLAVVQLVHRQMMREKPGFRTRSRDSDIGAQG